MRRRLFLPAALCLAACVPALAAGATTLAGTVDTRVADVPGDADVVSELLSFDGTRHSLVPADAAAADQLHAVSGMPARVTMAADGTVTAAAPAPGLAPAAAPKAMTLLAVIITPAGTTQEVTQAELSGRLFTDSGSVAAYLNAQAPAGLSLTGTVVGPYATPANPSCDEDALLADARSALSANGVSTTGYTHLMVSFPDPNATCGWSGLASVGGPYSWITDGSAPKVLAHELGHNIGLYHANSLACSAGGTPVAFSAVAKCTPTEYGDTFSTMGRGTGTPGPTFSAQDREAMGWMGDPGFAGRPTTVSLDPVPTFAAANPRRVEFPISATATASVEYRTVTGFDAPLAAYGGSGVTVYVRDQAGFTKPDGRTLNGTFVVDAAPATADIRDAALVPGTTVALGTSGASVTLTGTPSGFGASVAITPLPDEVAPSTPGGVTARMSGRSSAEVTWTASTDNVAVKDYRVLVDGTVAATTTTTTSTLSGLTEGAHSVTVVARDLNRNESAPSAAVPLNALQAPRFTAPVTATRMGANNADVRIAVPAIDDAAGVRRASIFRNGVALDVLAPTASPQTYTDRAQRGAATYRVDIESISGAKSSSEASVAAVPALTPPAPTKAATKAPPTLSGRLRLQCRRSGCTLRADRGSGTVTRIVVKLGRATLGVRNGTLGVRRVPPRTMARPRTVTVVAFTAAGVRSRTYTVRLPRHGRLGLVVSGALR